MVNASLSNLPAPARRRDRRGVDHRCGSVVCEAGMKRFLLVLALPVAVAACSSPAKDAENTYKTIKAAGGSYAESCRAARVAATAWAAEGDAEKYKRWSEDADIQCYLAQTANRPVFPAGAM